MIIHLNENRFFKLFLIESKNSKRADKQTIQLIAQRSGWGVDDDRTIQTQGFFKDTYFGSEGVNDDWFIVLEPNFCAAAIDKGLINGDNSGVYDDLLELVKYAHRKAKGLMTTKGREAMLQYVSSLKKGVSSWDSLYEMVGKPLEDERREAMERANQTESGTSEYSVKGPLSFKEAQRYGDCTAYQDGGSEICYTQDGRTWNQYTKNDKYSVYVMLKQGWGEVPDEHDGDYEDPESAYDTYGMSMIFVIVDEASKLKTCNTRWNHEGTYDSNHDVDFALDEVELSELIGRPFSEVFKPKEPLTFEERVNMALEMLNNDEYDDYNDYNDEVEGFFDTYDSGGDADKVSIENKWNFIIFDTDNDYYHLASEQWFDGVGLYYKLDEEGEFGLGNVYVKGRGYNYIKNDGTFLLDEWVDSADYFKGSHATIFNKGNYYIVDRFGTIFNRNPKEVFDDIAKCVGEKIFEKVDFYTKFLNSYDIYLVRLLGRYNLVMHDKLVSPNQWFEYIDLNFTGMSVKRVLVEIDGKCNFLNLDNGGGLLLPSWVEQADPFCYEYGYYYAEINDKGKKYCIDVNGNDITNEVWG